jgi:hypothetical protein
MNARSMASARGLSGDVLALASQSQVLLAAFDRAAPLQMRFEPVNLSSGKGFSGDLEVSCIDIVRLRASGPTDTSASLLAALTSAQVPTDAAKLGVAGRSVYQVALVALPAALAAGDVLGLEVRTYALDFTPLIVQWLHSTTEEPMLAVSESAGGRVRVYAAQSVAHGAAQAAGSAPRELVELDATCASMALTGLPLVFPSPVLALAEWTCARTGWTARVAGCEDGTLELVATPPGAERTRLFHRIRVERPINVACLFGGTDASLDVAPLQAADGSAAPGDAPTLHLLIGSVLCGACVYADVLRSGLSTPVRALPNAESVLCAAPWRSHPHALLIGTWSRTLHCLQLVRERASASATSPGWQCVPVWSRELPHALYGIQLLDLTHDGVDEVVVRTLQGVHVLQEDLPRVCGELEVGLGELLKLLPDAAARAGDVENEDGDLEVLMSALSRGCAIEALRERLRALRPAKPAAGTSSVTGELGTMR